MSPRTFHPFKKRHKYGVGPREKRTRDGFLFDSQLEAKRYDSLKLMQERGLVLFFLRQVPFHLPGNTRYAVDFQVFWSNGRVTFEDSKGVKTEVYRLKKRQVEDLYPIEITEV